MNMDPHELVPLEDGNLPSIIRPSRRFSRYTSRSCIRAPLKVVRLFILLIVLPTAFIVVPLYMRYRVFSSQIYPMGMTDMRLIDGRISPTWCQRQVVKSNTTFNAFVVPEQPQLSDELVPVSMSRVIELEDDMKEYWGFYLLQGSTVTVSPCVRWPGASLVMIKGYKHLKECAYIGDDSSEELDELLEANKLGLLSNISLYEKILQLKKVDGKANHPETMKRHKAGVSFLDPSHLYNDSSTLANPAFDDITEHDPKELREILEHIHAIQNSIKQQKAKTYQPPDHLMALPGLHRHRDTNVDKDERQWISFKDIDGNSLEKNNSTVNHLITTQNQGNGLITIIHLNTTREDNDPNTNVITEEFNNKHNSDENAKEFIKRFGILLSSDKPSTSNVITKASSDNESTKLDSNDSANNSDKNEESTTVRIESTSYVNKVNDIEEERDEKNTIDLDDKLVKDKSSTVANAQDPEISSREVFEEVLNRLQKLGARGKRVLKRLHQSMGMDEVKELASIEKTIMSQVTGSDEELDRLRQVLVEAIDEEKTRPQREQKRKAAAEEARAKRELMLGDSEFRRSLNEDDEARDYAAEEDLDPDGYAEHHTRVNETTPLDMSNSEFWSSFSSSEEALLECEGLILNLPLTPSAQCRSGQSEDVLGRMASRNSLTYRVPANGYYFFVFNSENEVQTNFIHVRFDLQKTRYDLARTALRECRNSTEKCELLLDIFSSQKVVLELPLRDNQSLWNEQFVVYSECEPRTSIYVACVIAVPVLIMIFAFQ